MSSTPLDDAVYSDESEDYEYDYSDDDDDVLSVEEGVSQDGMEIDTTTEGERMYNKRLAPNSSYSPSVDGNGSGRKYGSWRRKSDNGNPNAAPMAYVTEFSSSTDIRMLNSSEILPVMRKRIREVTEVLDIPACAASVLLREHKWLKESLYEKFYNDPDKIQEKYGVRGRCQSVSKPPRKKSSRKRECEICYEENTDDNMMAMPCGHEFCRVCWHGFIECAINSGPSCVRMTCPEAGCSEAVTEEEVAACAPDLLPKFQDYQLRSFVEMNSMTRWCPGPGCNRVAMSNISGFNGIACCDGCYTSFCLRCGSEPHAPASCNELARWNEKCRNESETANWILANTKPCPKCSSRIEKNQGCNHMSCQQCKYEFCWICLAPWSDHGANTGGYYKCNKYDPNAAVGDDQSDAARAKRELDKYLHYYKRYHAHSEAQKFAKKQLKDTESRMVLLQESTDNSTWADVEFLKSAVEQLVECRRVLKYTYTFAYYMTETRSNQKERFEHHQEMLEKFTEKLSEVTEKPLGEMDRTDVVNQTRVVNRFMKNILKYVEDGME